jgi:hypothetical protein
MHKLKPIELKVILNKHKGKIVVDKPRQPCIYENADEVVHFSIAALEKRHDTVYAIKDCWCSCREDITNNILYYRHRDVSYPYTKYTAASEKDALTTILIASKIVDNLRDSVRVLNYFEKKSKWGLSFVADTTSEDHVLLVGSKYWTYTSMHMSWYLLLVRLIMRNPIAEHESTPNYLKRMSLEYYCAKPTARSNEADKKHLNEVLKSHEDIFNIFVKHRKELLGAFGNVGSERRKDFQDANSDGILNLIRASKVICDLKTKFKGDVLKDLIDVVKGNDPKHYNLDKLRSIYCGKVNSLDEFDSISRMYITEFNYRTIDILAELLETYKGKRVKI